MCGIVGLHGRQQDGWLDDMNAVQLHRGPDDTGVFRDRDRSLALATRRLAILDIPGGRQPMTTPDGRYTQVYNVEIYNAAELTFSQSLEDIASKTAITDHHPDAREGITSFQEKRAPQFNAWLAPK